MTKESEKFIADKPELNIATKEEVSLIKIKLGKSFFKYRRLYAVHRRKAI